MTLNRRVFLRQTAGLAIAGGASYGLLSAFGCGSVNVAPAGLPWNALARSLTGRLVRPGDAGFARLALPNNLRYANVLPAGIALCANAADVSTSILWARNHGVPIVARSGGHSYAGYSTTMGLMIDVSAMNGFSFDRATGIATLEGGARNGDVYAQCRKLGVAITHGRCLQVGVAGLVLGGGVGFNMRTHGLTCDQLVSSDIVTANGRMHQLVDDRDDDLLWACRGAGGGNFGINTSFRFQTFEVGPITVYDLFWDDDTENVFLALVNALEAAPPSLGCKVSASLLHGAAPNVTVEVLGQMYGTPAELHEILQSVYTVARPSSGFVNYTAYWQGQDLISEPGLPEFYQERSRFFDEAMSGDDVATIFAWLRRWPATVKSAAFKMFQTGGRVNATPPGATAFVHRSSRWLSSVSVNWEDDTPAGEVARNLDWQSGFYDAIVPLAKGGAYQNFIDPSLRDWKSAYYGSNLARLETIKRRVDPAHIFTFQEAIP